jgi:IS30 family transposase
VRSWGLSVQEQEERWRRWRQGESLRLIARRMGKRGPSVRALVVQSGGGKQPPRRRPARSFSADEREEISRGIAAGDSCPRIARRLGRAPSTGAPEVARNRGRRRYRAQIADAAATGERPDPSRASWPSTSTPRSRGGQAQGVLVAGADPRLAPGAYPDDPSMPTSHQTIDLSLYVPHRGALHRDLRRCLRTGRAMRHPRGKRLPAGERPAPRHHLDQSAARRGRPAHGPRAWGRRGAAGQAPSAVLTLVERTRRLVVLVALPAGWRAEQVRPALTAAMGRLPERLRRSLTWDHGKEMAEHARFTTDTGVPVCFCDPHRPWQRASNENANGLLGQYLPRTADLRRFSQADLDRIAAERNDRPRQIHGLQPPSQILAEALR